MQTFVAIANGNSLVWKIAIRANCRIGKSAGVPFANSFCCGPLALPLERGKGRYSTFRRNDLAVEVDAEQGWTRNDRLADAVTLPYTLDGNVFGPQMQ